MYVSIVAYTWLRCQAPFKKIFKNNFPDGKRVCCGPALCRQPLWGGMCKEWGRFRWVKQKFTSPMVAALMGTESRHFYFHFGLETSMVGDKLSVYKIEHRQNNYHALSSFVIASGWKF
jgi:hypothetical protein